MSSAAPLQQAKTESPANISDNALQLASRSKLTNSTEEADTRAQTNSHRQLQSAANHSAQSHQFKALQQIAQGYTRTTQLQNISAMMTGTAAQRIEDEEPLQAKVIESSIQREVAVSAPQETNPNNTGLPDNLKSGIESLSGMSMDHVKVHYNSSQPAQLNAHAYAQGSEIHVAPGQEQHLPHEAWHVVQQAQGRVKPTMQMKAGVPVNDDAGLESEADVMGAKALEVSQRVTDPEILKNVSTNFSPFAQRVVQRTSLNGVVVNTAIPYPNGNQAAVLTHMAGEWDVANGLAVGGGHLLTSMVAQWGPSVAGSNPNAASPTGVHFEGGIPGDNITPHQHSFRLVANDPAHQGQKKVSNPKQSTFWPASWSAANLVQTLNNSWRNGAATEWASQENMSYWYRWQTLGANTLFPIEKVPVATGTLRNRMKAGRNN